MKDVSTEQAKIIKKMVLDKKTNKEIAETTGLKYWEVRDYIQYIGLTGIRELKRKTSISYGRKTEKEHPGTQITKKSKFCREQLTISRKKMPIQQLKESKKLLKTMEYPIR